MKDKLKISESVQTKVNEITAWCFLSNCNTFNPFIDFKAHVCQLEVRIYIDGYDNSKQIKSRYCYLNKENGGDQSEILNTLDEFFVFIKDLKEESDNKWSGANIESSKLANAKLSLAAAENKSAELKAQIKAMEGK